MFCRCRTSEASQRTLETLMRRDVYFVPESKLGSDLLREMQKNNIRMAIVVDEYGGVAGLVTIEDSSRGNRGRNPGRTREAGNRAGE